MNITLADSNFATPRKKIDLLLGADIIISLYSDILLYGPRCGPMNIHTTFETQFGWVLTGKTSGHSANHLSVVHHHIAVASGDDLIRKFWETEENPKVQSLKNALL